MSYRVLDGCDGCGICVRACPRGAFVAGTGEGVPLAIDSVRCNDCVKCTVVCPLGVIAPDPGWATCWGRGCPLTSRRYSGWGCTEGRERCPRCGNPLWKAPDDDAWACPACDHALRVMCPKARRAFGRLHRTARGGTR